MRQSKNSGRKNKYVWTFELSRQRLRSSLIEKSFENVSVVQANACSRSISEQIINTIKENYYQIIIQILVKCNTALAENLINQKTKLNKLEKIIILNNF